MNTNGINIKHLVVIISIILVSWVLSLFGSRFMLTQMYEGNSFSFLNDLLTNKDSHQLDYYFRQLEPPIAAAHLMLVVVGIMYVVRGKESALLWLGLLIIGDVILLVFHEFYGGPLLDIVVDWAIPEMYQYFKELFLAVLFFALYKRHGQPLYLLFTGLAVFLFLDDSLKYHERVGHALESMISGTSLPVIIGVAPNDIGEVMSVLPLLLIVPFGSVWFFSADSETRKVVLVFTAMLFMLFFFGVVIDVLNGMREYHVGIDFPYQVEDFGEMLTLSCWLSYTICQYWKLEKRGQGRMALTSC